MFISVPRLIFLSPSFFCRPSGPLVAAFPVGLPRASRRTATTGPRGPHAGGCLLLRTFPSSIPIDVSRKERKEHKEKQRSLCSLCYAKRQEISPASAKTIRKSLCRLS